MGDCVGRSRGPVEPVRAAAAAITLASILAASGAAWAACLHQLSGPGIRAHLAGQVLTDGAHWSETYERSGRLVVNDVGNVSAGSWRVEGKRLCKDRPGVLNECYTVWLDGSVVELRHDRYAPILATLQPVKRR